MKIKSLYILPFFVLIACQNPQYKNFLVRVAFLNPNENLKATIEFYSKSDSVFLTLAKSGGAYSVVEPDVIRRNLMDTFLLNHDDAKTVSRWLDQDLPESDVYGKNNGFRFEWTVDNKNFSIFGMPENQQLLDMNTFVMGQWEDRFRKINIEAEQISVLLINVSARDTILVARSGYSLSVTKNSKIMKVLQTRYLESRRILENSQARRLPSNRSLEKKDPNSYIFKMENEEGRFGWTVYGPSHLEDKRYFEVISCLENLVL